MAQNSNPELSMNDVEHSMNANWNERKHLVTREFDLRERTQQLIIDGASKGEIAEARRLESECGRDLARNRDEYEAVLDAWIAALPE